MGLTIQFESHRVELPFVYEMEHDPGVLEYYDQPPSIPLAYHGGERKTLFGHAHTGLLRNPSRLCGVGGMQILRGSSKTGHQELQTATSRWQRQMALPAGRSAQLADWAWTIGYGRQRRSTGFSRRNLTFLEDYLRCDPAASAGFVDPAIKAAVEAKPGILLQRTVGQGRGVPKLTRSTC